MRSIRALLILYLSALLTYDYYMRIEGPKAELRMAFHRTMIDGSAPYQHRYRILLPHIAERISLALEKVLPRPKAFNLAFMSLNFCALCLFFDSLWRLLERWFDWRIAAFAIALAAVMISFTFRDHMYHPWSFWEAAFCALAMRWIDEKRWAFLPPLCVAAALTRETTAFLPLGFLLSVVPLNRVGWRIRALLRQRSIQSASSCILLWGLTLAVVHAVVGYRPPTFFIETAINGNLGQLRYALILNALIAGPLLLLAKRGLPSSPPVVQGMAVAAIPYACVLIVIGYWWEIRYWMPMIPLLISAAIHGVLPTALPCGSPSNASGLSRSRRAC